MAELYKFFNAVEISPGVFDREYQEADFADYFGSLLSSGLINTDNIPGMVVSVEAGTLNTVVSRGKAIIKGHMYENTTPLTLAHNIPEATLNRIDRIVLRLDSRNQSRFIKLFVKEGVSSATPVAPILQRDNFIHELSLARVLVRANTVQLLANDLVDERLNEDLCGLAAWNPKPPTQQFQEQWDEFMAGIVDSGFASAEELASHKAEDTHLFYADDVGTANTKVVTINPSPASYRKGLGISFTNLVSNTGAVTLNVNGLGVIPILKSNGAALTSGNLKANIPYTVRHNGTSFILQGEGGEYGTAIDSDVIVGKSIGTESGLVNGSMINRGNIGTHYLSSQNAAYTIPAGYHNGLGKVQASYPSGKTKWTTYIGDGVTTSFNVGFKIHTIIAVNTKGGKTVYSRDYNGLWYQAGGVGSPMPWVTVASDNTFNITNYSGGGSCLITVYQD